MPQQLSIGKHRLHVNGTALIEREGKDPNVELYVQDVENPDEIGTIYLGTGDAAWEWTEKKLTHLGWAPKANDYRFDYLNPEEGEKGPLHGVEFDVDVQSKPYTGQDGKERDGIQINFVGLGGFSERMSAEKAAAFSKQLRARLIASKGQAAATPAKTGGARGPSRATQEANDDVWGKAGAAGT